ncbi:MAG: NAD(P)H-dependent oxidoreductase [Planctomycetota bacterium]|nr:NAD(P)H-dependent oxidoreductase [Planctomycetota bacterium]
MAQPKILAFAGSAREGSYNKLLIRAAAEGARKAGAEANVIDLRDFPMPLYDGDDEAKGGLPDNAKKLKQLFLAHQGLLIAAPEYNSSVTPLLKNTIDWVSRPGEKGEAPLACYTGKVAGLLAASPGALGGLRGLVHVRAILQNIQVMVVPDQFAVPKANEAFGPDGALKDARQRESAERVGARVAQVLAKLVG